MKEKLNQNKAKTQTREKTYNQCITCRRGCSMSGLCMRQWPEFSNSKRKIVPNNDQDQKNDCQESPPKLL